MTFKDRVDAGQKLAKLLLKFQGQNGIVYGLPRGGIIVAAEVAKTLNMPLDVLVTKKVGHPKQPEYAVCAVTENRCLHCNHSETAKLDKKWLDDEIEKKYQEAKEKARLYRSGYQAYPAQDKLTFIVDDGAATGLTISAAISDLLKRKPTKIIVAVPVIPAEVSDNLALITNEVIALEIPPPKSFLGAVGTYYDYFPQVNDEEVIALLDNASCAPSR